MKNIALTCLAATALIAGCGSSGSSSSEEQVTGVSCPEAGTAPSEACLATGGGEFLKSSGGSFSYKLLFPSEQVSGSKNSNQAVVVFDKNQCEGAMAAQGDSTFYPSMDKMGHDLGPKNAPKVRTVRDETCKNVFQVSEIKYMMGGVWQFYVRPTINRAKSDEGKIDQNVK